MSVNEEGDGDEEDRSNDLLGYEADPAGRNLRRNALMISIFLLINTDDENKVQKE
jgi:hypothetical protein